LGARLREVRRDASLTGRALAMRTGWHLSKISRIEHGKQSPSEDDLRAWCRHCGAEDQIPDLIATIRNIEAMWLEWKRLLNTGTKRRQQAAIPIFEQTRIFRNYHPSVIVGILQTAEYAAEIFRRAVEFYDIPDDVAEGVASRMERQQFLYKGDRRFYIVQGEHALYAPVGNTEIMRGQLDRLLAVMSMQRISFGIIPLKADHKPWPLHTFMMFDDRLVQVETISAELTVTQPREVALYAKAFSRLQESAVYGRTARELIVQALTDLD
jgi:transcriptional regulator with XRE-family HTH domain